MRDNTHGPWLDVPGAAEYLGVTERWIRTKVAERRLPHAKVGKFVRFKRDDLDAFAEAGRRVEAVSR